MRIGLMVDCNCDLPRDYIDKHKIMVLPVSISIDAKQFEDVRAPQETVNFYAQHLGDKTHNAATAPPTVDRICDLYLQRMVLDHDYVLCETIMRTRSFLYEYATKASYAILKKYHMVRHSNNVAGTFSLRVINTQTWFAGQAALAAETVRLIESGMPFNEVRTSVDQIAEHAYAYTIPDDPFYLRERARKKGDHSVGWTAAALATVLDIKPIICARQNNTTIVTKKRGFRNAAQHLFKHIAALAEAGGLLSPHVCVSYAGNPKDVLALPGFDEMKKSVAKKGVNVLLSVSSMSSGIHLGPGTLMIGLLAKPHSI